MKGKYQVYLEYKDSKSKWLDTIPAHWERTPIKHILSIRVTDGPHETPEFVDKGIPFLSAEAIKKNALDFSKKRGYITLPLHKIYSQKCLPQINDVLMVKSGNTTGNLAIVETEEEFNIWSPLALIRANNNKALPRLIFYSMLADFFKTSVELSWNQGTQPNIGMGVIENLHIAVPPLEEQYTIINFLDHETTKIDTLIEKQQQLIKLLKEKRQAVISHAVTKGLNPNVLMRDSGVEWLGEVPEHWHSIPLKHISKIQYGIGEPPKYHEKGVPLIRATNVRSGKISRVNLVFVNPEDIPENRIVWLSYGDIIVVRSGAGTGDSSIIPEEYHNSIAGFDMVVKPTKCTSKFLGYALLSNYIRKNQIDLEKNRAAQPHLNAEELGECFVLLPKNNEQLKIVKYIDDEVFQLDYLISKGKEASVLLKERRTALISAAVTGKIDVRNWQAPKQNNLDSASSIKATNV